MSKPVVDDFEVFEESTLAEELAGIPAGPALAVRLASVDRSVLDAADVLAVADARQRLIAHQEAQLLADVRTVARKVPNGGPLPRSLRHVGPYPWAEVECAFALRWTLSRAAGKTVLAEQLVDRLPRVFTALDEGRIDVPKAQIIADLVMPVVDDELAAGLADAVLEKAQEWTTAQLRARLRRLVLAAQPDMAAKRARAGIGERRVAAYPDIESGLAALAGYELAPHRVAAVMERLDAVAKAAKAAGDQRTMDQLRADIFLDLLCGEGIAAGGDISDGSLGLGVAPAGPASADAEPVPWPDQPEPEPETEPEAETLVDPDGDRDLWAFGIPEPPALAESSDDDEVAQRRRWLADFDQLPAGKPATRCVLCGHLDGPPATPGPMPGPRRGVVEITVGLSTLMGLSDLPAELNGFGPVAADIARQIVAHSNDAQWRFSAYNYLNRLEHHGTTHARPGGHQTKRRPNPALAAFVKARDRSCVAPGCRRIARRCEVDHTLDWVKGGETVHCNLGLLCKRHHAYKHATGCQITQLSPGVFVWTTPLSMQYLTRSEPPLLDDNHLAGLPRTGEAGLGEVDR